MNAQEPCDAREAAVTAATELQCSSWSAVTFGGALLVGNGLGDTGRGATWGDALADLRAKHAARQSRLARLEREQAGRAGAIRGALLAAGIVAAVSLATWWALR